MQDFLKKLLKNDFFIVGLVFLVLILMVSYINKSQEGLEGGAAAASTPEAAPEAAAEAPVKAAKPDQQPQLSADALLQPEADAAEFVQKNEVTELLKEKNFLVAGQHIGLDTILQSKKIAYHDIRSAPPIPKEQVGPWNQSSYEQPAGGPVARRYLEIGSQ